MTDRFATSFNPFVLPFLFGMAFVLSYCLFGILRIFLQLNHEDRRKFLLSLVTPSTALKNIRDIVLDCLIHVKLWKRNRLLGYMHSSIAFGWFLLIVFGHIEVMLFIPERLNRIYYPIFFNYFVDVSHPDMAGRIFLVLMDCLLLYVLSGIALAVLKRLRSRMFGMRRTTRHGLLNQIGMYSLWAIFPLRMLAEHSMSLNYWWAYSTALCVFFTVLPFSRYMHIPAEMLLIPMRNAGLKIRGYRSGFARAQVLSCPNCGVCIDACPMSVDKVNLKECTVYLTRQIRRGNEKRVDEISDKCLLCGKCREVCQVGVDGPGLRMMHRQTRTYAVDQDYSSIDTEPFKSAAKGSKLLYFSGCMSQLTPEIGRSVDSLLTKAGVDFNWMDRDGGLCCGRPLLTAGRTAQAEALVRKNEEIILGSGAGTLVVSCPICFRMFKENYNLPGVEVRHYSDFILELIRDRRIEVEKGDVCYVFHDPCELGRGCGIYDEPRKLIALSGCIAEAPMTRAESVCCGGSLGSLSLGFRQREKLTRSALGNLYASGADAIATACPLCKSTFSRYSSRPVRDIAEIVNSQIK